MNKKYDFVIVGAGLFGVTCARLLTDKGFKCLVIERSKHVGGLCATHRSNDIDVHLLSPHILYTDNDDVWSFLNRFGKIHEYHHSILAMNKEKMYHLPINMNTFHEVYGIHFPVEAYKKIQDEVEKQKLSYAESFEEQIIMNCGYSTYMEIIKPYTEKLWGIPAKNMPIEHADSVPIKYLYDDDYFDTKYQGIPEDGYTKLIENMLGDDIDILLGRDFLDDRDKYINLCNIVIYSGPIDEFCSYIYGKLDWRTLKIDIKDESKTSNNMFGIPVINVLDKNNDLLKIVEHKWLTPWRNTDTFNNSTIVSYIYASEWEPGKYAMYPVPTNESLEKYQKYKAFVQQKFPTVVFGGRAGSFRPLNMSQTIEIAMKLVEQINK